MKTIVFPITAFRPIRLTNPFASSKDFILSQFKKSTLDTSVLFDSVPISYSQPSYSSPAVNFSWTRFRQNHRRLVTIIWVGLALTLLGGFVLFLSRLGSTTTLSAAKVNVNQTYSITARDQKGNPVGKDIQFHITEAEKASSVLVQGKKANVRNGKRFLLVNFEIDNPDNTVYFINPTDLVRYLRNDGKKFAPTVYQGILQIRPTSTKSSNIGFVVDQKETNFKLEVGELENSKQGLEINF